VDYFKSIGQSTNYSVFSLPNIKTTFKLTIVDSPQRVDPQLLADVVFKKINEIMFNPALPIGDILAFVTSESEIAKVKQLLERTMSKYPANNNLLKVRTNY
jgi:HrpA-like RNA helicase